MSIKIEMLLFCKVTHSRGFEIVKMEIRLGTLFILVTLVVHGKSLERVLLRSTGLIWNPNATNTPEELAKLDILYGYGASPRKERFIPESWNSMDKGAKM